jgi:hypothetical protein
MFLTLLPALAYPVTLVASLSGALTPPDVIVVLKNEYGAGSEMVRLHRTYRMAIGFPCAAMNGFTVYSRPDVISALRKDRAVARLLPNSGNSERLCAGS